MIKRTSYFLCIVFLGYITLSLSLPYSGNRLQNHIAAQISYIDDQLISGADQELQLSYPEGYIFSNAIFALVLIELNDIQYQSILERCIINLLSDAAKSTFEEDLEFQYGAFYNGWVNYVLKRYLKSDMTADIEFFQKVTKEHLVLSERIHDLPVDSLTLVESYREMIWPGDNMAYLASIEKENHPTHFILLQNLLLRTTDEDDLIIHDLQNYKISRGSSQALITYFMAQIEIDQAKEYNARFLETFCRPFFGIDFILEHKNGSSSSDIDSGPIVSGIGSVATIMNVKTQAALGHQRKWTFAALNLAGLPIKTFGKKRYLFGQELMFDLFMLWCAVDFIEK